ncbi:uncharacterized protein LOC126382132 [Pectinophora gossypiella]|uniref:uncharacterized protein LOC126382132 n=1 Tax=Pectinophora gossypiella TaxID=13191 RepID=UPI00214DFB24|nr:uncharacterized protein LOC126382132 [Pectinophora gossypiella]
MTIPKKQMKITKLFKKGATRVPISDDCGELQEEVRQLEQRLREKQNELFQIQRNTYRHKLSPPKAKEDNFVRPQKIVLSNSIDSLKRSLELVSMLSGMEVQSYVSGEHCCVLFHMQHAAPHAVSHGMRIDIKSGKNEVSASSLPLGFNLTAVMEDFDNVMKPDCLGAIRKALVAYYDRLEQFQNLKKLLNIEAELFKTLDGSHMEVSMFVQGDDEEDQFPVTLLLDYRVYDIRPKNYAVKEIDLPEGAADLLREQCAVFKKKPLHKAFKEAFFGDAQYRLVQQMGPRPAERRPRPKKRFRPNKHQYNDDTFLPEDCSDQGEEDEDAE